MKVNLKTIGLVVMVLSLVAVVGCGVPKDKYEALLNEKIALEEKASVLTKAREALKAEYDNLLSEKMDASTKLETAVNERAALKAEYDKILDEKIALKAAYDKLVAENKALQDSIKP